MGLVMFALLFQNLTIYFSSWNCICVTLLFIVLFFGCLLYRETRDEFRLHMDSPAVKCVEYGSIRIYFNKLSCLAGAYRKKHKCSLLIFQLLLASVCVLCITKLSITRSIFWGISSVICLTFLFVHFSLFNLIACHDSISSAAFFLATGLASNVVIDTDCLSLMVFFNDQMVAAAPICLKKNFDPKASHFEVFLGLPGPAREIALCGSFNGVKE